MKLKYSHDSMLDVSIICLYLISYCFHSCESIDGSRLAEKLGEIKTDIGVDHMQAEFDKLPYKTKSDTGQELLQKIQNSLNQSLSGLQNALEAVKTTLHLDQDRNTISLPKCCELSDDRLTYIAAFRKKVGIVSFNSEASTPENDCYAKGLAYARNVTVESLTSHIFEKIQASSSDEKNFEKALMKAFRYFENAIDSLDNREQIILFLTTDKHTTGRNPVQVIGELNQQFGNKIRVFTYLIGQNAAAKQVLEDMANQTLTNTSYGERRDGHFDDFPFKKQKELSAVVATFYVHLNPEGGPMPTFTVPYVDPFSEEGLITSYCITIKSSGGDLRGVMCTDVKVSELLSQVEHFSEDEYSYAFIIDGTGRAIMHPLLPNAAFEKNNPVLVDISVLERAASDVSKTKSETMIQSMKSGGSGSAQYDKLFIKPRGKLVNDGSSTSQQTGNFYWGPVPNSNFSLCVVLVDVSTEIDKADSKRIIENETMANAFMYHNRDLATGNFSECKFYKRRVTLERSGVKFSPSAFLNPFSYIDKDETAQDVIGYERFLTGESDHNKVFKSTVRPSIWATHKAEEFWKENPARQVAWRYIGTKAGFIRNYPGVRMEKSYDHQKRGWWKQALAHPGQITLTTPYVDAWGSGIVMTIAQTIYKGGSTTVTGVLGADFPLEYFNSFINSVYPECEDDNARCMVIDDSGFIIMHPRLTNATSEDKFKEPKHITVEEPEIAVTLTNNIILIESICQDYSKSKNLKSFRVVMRDDTPNGLEFRDTGNKFELRPISGPNAFIIKANSFLTNQTCRCDERSLDDVMCTKSCSKCLCHTDIVYDVCSNTYNTDNNYPCSARSPDTSGTSNPDDTIGLDECFSTNCANKYSETNCYSEAECSWCKYKADGNILGDPPCCRLKEKCSFGRATSTVHEDTCQITTTVATSTIATITVATTTIATPTVATTVEPTILVSNLKTTVAIAVGCAAVGILLTLTCLYLIKYLRNKFKDSKDPYMNAGAHEELEDPYLIPVAYEELKNPYLYPVARDELKDDAQSDVYDQPNDDPVSCVNHPQQ